MFARKINVFILRTLLVGMINVVTLYFIGHYIGPGPLGIIAYGASFIQMFFLFSELGFGQAHIKRISEGRDLGQCIGTYFFIKTSLILILTILVISTLLIKKYIFNSHFVNPEQERVILLLLVPMILVQLSTVALNTFEAQRESAKMSIPQILGPLFKAPVTIIVAIFGLGVYGLLFARYINGIVVIIIAYYLLNFPIKIPKIQYIKSYFRFASKAFVLFILVQATMQIDKLMIGTYVSLEAVGMYYSIQSIMAILAVIPNAVGSLLFPTISEHNAKGNIGKIEEYVFLSEKYITMILLPIAITIAFFSRTIILLLLGENFSSAAIPLSILSIYFLINGIRKPIASILAGTNRMELLVKISIISVSVNILLNFILIPKQLFGIDLPGLGLNGAAYATLISGLAYTVLCRVYTYKRTGIRISKKLYTLYLAGASMLLFFIIVNSYFPLAGLFKWSKISSLILFCFLGLGVYVAVLSIFKDFTKKEVFLILESLNPKKMRSYIKNEIKR